MVQRYRYLLEALGIIVITGVIGVLVAFSGTFGRTESSAPVVINEIYTAFLEQPPIPHQWFELYNRTGEWQVLGGWTAEVAPDARLSIPRLLLPPQGFAIVAFSSDQFAAEHPNYTGLVVGLDVSEAGTGMDIDKGYLVLRDAQGRPVDAVNWGQPEQAPGDVQLWEKPTFEPGAGWTARPGKLFSAETDLIGQLDGGKIPQGLREQFQKAGRKLGENAIVEVRTAGSSWRILDGEKRYYIQKEEQKTDTQQAKQVLNVYLRADYTRERRPLGLDTDRPSDFILQPFPSPGTVNLPSAPQGIYSFFIDWTNAAAVAGGILLWIAFVFIALVARRFEALTQQRTFWWAMLAAPSGIVVYALVQAYGFLVRGRMTPDEQMVGFLVLFASAVLCTALVFLFRRRAKSILEG